MTLHTMTQRTSPTLSADPEDLPDSLGNVGMDPAQTRALAVIRAAGTSKPATRGRTVKTKDRPVTRPVYPDRQAAELLQLRVEVEAAKTSLTHLLAVGSLAIVAGVTGLIVLAAR